MNWFHVVCGVLFSRSEVTLLIDAMSEVTFGVTPKETPKPVEVENAARSASCESKQTSSRHTNFLCGQYELPVWSSQPSCVVSTNFLCGRHKLLVWSVRTTCVVITTFLCGQYKFPVWSSQTSFVVVTNFLCGRHNLPVWSSQTSCVVR